MISLICALLLARPTALQNTSLDGASRKDNAGWIYLKLKGTPKDVGYQYGYLAAKEIDDAHKALKGQFSRAPYDWAWARQAAKSLFWDKLDPEYQQEIAAQADGLRAKGFSYDTWDVLAYNANIELHDYYIPYLTTKNGGAPTGNKRTSCSAFVATGSTTKDGKIVMGHNLWWDYLMGERANVILDITPEHGNRFVMDAFCGFIHSGTDFAVNSAGLVLCETTIAGFAGFDPNGIPEFERMRKAIQYGNSLDDMVAIFKKGNNGGYANTWLMADSKTNEIGKLELGLKNVTFEHTKDGYFVGSNFPENPKLIAQECPGGWDANPASNGCECRRLRWNTLLTENKGKVDAEMAKSFLADTYDQVMHTKGASGSTLCGKEGLSGAVNAKVIDASMAASMTLWARMGISDGEPFTGSKSYGLAYLRDMPTEPWVILP